uniref:K Homology domain-containing protein n=1 Tax=Timema poppense TaxID=170557 RepID=A0A7R9H0Y0_TIMPO|nr:unnamed protein product [Timema poppensis]
MSSTQVHFSSYEIYIRYVSFTEAISELIIKRERLGCASMASQQWQGYGRPNHVFVAATRSQIAAKINPGGADSAGQKRPLEDGSGMDWTAPADGIVAQGKDVDNVTVLKANCDSIPMFVVDTASVKNIDLLLPNTIEGLRAKTSCLGLWCLISEPEAKKVAAVNDPAGAALRAQQATSPGLATNSAAAQAAAVAARVAAAAAAGLQGLGVGVGIGPVQNEDMRVPDKMVGLIIGRGGEQISRLQNESGCKIQMAPDSGGLPERVCSLTGSRDSINRAKELIMNIVQQRSRTEGTGGGGGGGGGGGVGGGGGMGDMNMGGGPPGNHSHVEIMVPGPKVGLIIGKGGETIKTLQEKSGAKMVVIQDGPNQEQEKPLRISGDPQKVEYAKQLVYDLIAEKEMQQAYNRGGGGGGGGPRGAPGGGNHNFDEYGGNDGSGGGGDSVEVLVPRAAVGVVIGKGGDMIKKIQNETGARVQFQQGRDDGPGERRCLLTGKPQQVEQARRKIEELIDSVLVRSQSSPQVLPQTKQDRQILGTSKLLCGASLNSKTGKFRLFRSVRYILS